MTEIRTYCITCREWEYAKKNHEGLYVCDNCKMVVAESVSDEEV